MADQYDDELNQYDDKLITYIKKLASGIMNNTIEKGDEKQFKVLNITLTLTIDEFLYKHFENLKYIFKYKYIREIIKILFDKDTLLYHIATKFEQKIDKDINYEDYYNNIKELIPSLNVIEEDIYHSVKNDDGFFEYFLPVNEKTTRIKTNFINYNEQKFVIEDKKSGQYDQTEEFTYYRYLISWIMYYRNDFSLVNSIDLFKKYMEINDKYKALNVLDSLYDGKQMLTFDLITGILERIEEARKKSIEEQTSQSPTGQTPLYTQRLYRF